jgi:hypothetical protein
LLLLILILSFALLKPIQREILATGFHPDAKSKPV